MPSDPVDHVLGALPNELRVALVAAFNEIRRNFIEERWEPSELNGGKLCEVAYRVLEWESAGAFTPLGESLRDFRGSVRKFENDTSLPDGIRFHVPDALAFLYNLRNKRGVGHVGGDVDPNRMDAHAVLSVANWVMAELVRLLHTVDTASASAMVERIVERITPLVWSPSEGVRRVLRTDLSYREQVLVLLHSGHPDPITDDNLLEWTEYSNRSVFKKNVLGKLHRDRLVEYTGKHVNLSPSGTQAAEAVLVEA